MRSIVPNYTMEAPAGLQAALSALASAPGHFTPFAGGTDLMVVNEKGQLPPGAYLSLHRCPELRAIDVGADSVRIGALATYADVRDHAVIASELPMLSAAARESGAIAIQNRGTIGGNIMNASPAADTPPALLAYGAEVELASVRGSRTVPYAAFHLGYKKTMREADELLVAIHVPRGPSGRHHFYEKVGTRAFQAISKVCFAGTATVEHGHLRGVGVGLGSVGPVPLQPLQLIATLEGASLADAETLAGRAADAMRADISPIDDIRSTARYRLTVAANLAADFVRRLARHGA